MKKIKKHDSFYIMNYGFGFVLFFGLLFQGAFFPIQYLIFSFILVCVSSMFFIKRKICFGQNRFFVYVAIAFSCIYIMNSVFFADNRYEALLESTKVLCFSAAVFITGNYIKDSKAIFKIIYCGCFAMLIFGFLCYMNIISIKDGILDAGHFVRMQSLLQYANSTAVLMGSGFFLSLYYETISEKQREKTKYLIYSHLFLMGLFLTVSKGAIAITFIIVMALLFVLKNAEKAINVLGLMIISLLSACFALKYSVLESKYIFAGIFVFSVIAVYGFCLLKQKINKEMYPNILKGLFIVFAIAGIYFGIYYMGKMQISTATFIERLIYMADAIRLILSRPLTGIGAGNWDAMQYGVQTSKYSVQYIHNAILQLFLDGGIISGLLFLSMLFIFYKRRIKQFYHEHNAESLYVIAVVTLIFFHSLMDIDLNFPAVFALFGMLIAFDDSREEAPLNKGARKIMTVGAGILIICIGMLLIGQILYNHSIVLLNQKRYEESMRLCRINMICMPWSSQNQMVIANNSLGMTQDKTQYVAQVQMAQKLNPNERRYYLEQYSIAIKMEDYAMAYRACEQLMRVERLNQEHYKNALRILKKLKATGQIGGAEYSTQKEMVIGQCSKVNAQINPLTKKIGRYFQMEFEEDSNDIDRGE